MPKPYTIRLFVPDGDPNTFKIIDKMKWTILIYRVLSFINRRDRVCHLEHWL